MPGFRPPLDLSDILNQYEEFGGSSTAGMPSGTEWWQQRPGFLEDEQRREAAAAYAALHPQFVPDGPPACSTSTALVRDPQIVWDVLGYYRTLSVHVRASRAELMAAYQGCGPMPTAIQTHCFKQLWDPTVRREYDRTPLGSLYLGDPYVQSMLKRQAAQEARRRSENGVPTTAKEVIEEQYRMVTEDEPAVDGDPSDPQDAELSDPPPTVPSWPYGYFLWKIKTPPDTTSTIQRWQHLLVQALSERDHVLHLAVGLVGQQPHRFVVGHLGAQAVAFLGEHEDPTEEIAAMAADALMNPVN